MILSNLLETEQTVVVRIVDDNDAIAWKQRAELPAAQPNEAPSIRTEHALQSVEMGADFSVEVTAKPIEKTATGHLKIDCEDHEHVRIRLMKRYEGGEPVIDFQSC